VDSREALIKALVWRFFVAIPLGTAVAYFWLGELGRSIALVVSVHVISTFLYYGYEMMWPFLRKKFKHLQ